ncbi:MAG: PIN domain-containing protein [Magnetococcales bacterium]|nr:PIN domain-containing protein [Magnetococcales bacterium]
MASFTVILDACVLYPAPLRDLLIGLATTNLFRARWTDQIHEEWTRNLLKNRPDLSLKQLQRTRNLMDAVVEDCLVSGYEQLIGGLRLPDNNDRHVLAAAIRSGAEVIVTFNQKDFPSEILDEFNIFTEHPDDFVMNLIDLNPASVLSVARAQRNRLRNPPKSRTEFLDSLRNQQLTQTASFIQDMVELI